MAWNSHRAKAKLKAQQKKVAAAAVKKHRKGIKLKKIMNEISSKSHEIGS